MSQQGADESEGREAWQGLNSRKQQNISSVIICRCRLMKTRDPVKTERETDTKRKRERQTLIQVLPLATLAYSREHSAHHNNVASSKTRQTEPDKVDFL